MWVGGALQDNTMCFARLLKKVIFTVFLSQVNVSTTMQRKVSNSVWTFLRAAVEKDWNFISPPSYVYVYVYLYLYI